MRLKTIWTVRYFTFTERLLRSRDSVALNVARHLPKRIRYWTTISELGKATMKSTDVPATPLSDVLQQLDRPKTVR